MQFSVSAHESCTLGCLLLNRNGTKWTGNTLNIPAAPCSQQLLRRNKLHTGYYFFSFLVFLPHEMNVFVTDIFIDKVVTHMQGFSSGILIILLETVRYGEMWSNVWFLCMVNMYNIGVQIYTLHRFQVDFLKMSQFIVISPTICFIWNATFHGLLCSWTWTMHITLCAVPLQTQNVQEMPWVPAAVCSQQLLRETKFQQVAISLLVWSFHPMMWMHLWQIWL